MRNVLFSSIAVTCSFLSLVQRWAQPLAGVLFKGRCSLFVAEAGHGHGTPVDPKYGDFQMPHVSDVHKRVGHAIGTTMWFWIFYRAYYDLPTLLGHHPWHDEHGEH